MEDVHRHVCPFVHGTRHLWKPGEITGGVDKQIKNQATKQTNKKCSSIHSRDCVFIEFTDELETIPDNFGPCTQLQGTKGQTTIITLHQTIERLQRT